MRGSLFMLTALVVVSALAIGWFGYSVQRAMDHPLDLSPDPQYHVIPSGASFNEVVRALSDRGILTEPLFVLWYARWNGLAGGIKAGEYEIRSGITPRELLDVFISARVVQHALTLVEGWSFDEMVDAVHASEHLEHSLQGLDAEAIMSRLGVAGIHPEGRFFADTYHFPRGTSDVAFLRRAYQTMDRRLRQAWDQRAEQLPYRTPEDALIMASIIEKETGLATERARIAGVFVRRLARGIRLETDPTVIYGLGEAFDGNLRKRDLKTDTPYNTYLHKGLPPTPIAMPGAASIDAALHPLAGNELFFVADGDGGHHFSVTYAEHQKAVARYRKKRRRQTNQAASQEQSE